MHAGGGAGERCDVARRVEAQHAGALLGKPQVAIESARSEQWRAAAGGELRHAVRRVLDDTGGIDPHELLRGVLRDPEHPVGPDGNALRRVARKLVVREAVGRARMGRARVKAIDTAVATLERDPEPTVRAAHERDRRSGRGEVIGVLRAVLGDATRGPGRHLRRVDASDEARRVLGEPQIAVGPDGDRLGLAARPRRHEELAEQAAGGGVELADLTGPELGEPDVPVRPGDDSRRVRAERQRRAGARVLHDRAVDRSAPDPVALVLAEPHRPVRPCGDDVGAAAGCDPRRVLEEGRQSGRGRGREDEAAGEYERGDEQARAAHADRRAPGVVRGRRWRDAPSAPKTQDHGAERPVSGHARQWVLPRSALQSGAVMRRILRARRAST